MLVESVPGDVTCRITNYKRRIALANHSPDVYFIVLVAYTHRQTISHLTIPVMCSREMKRMASIIDLETFPTLISCISGVWRSLNCLLLLAIQYDLIFPKIEAEHKQP